MYAIVEIRGWQFKVTASDTIRVPKLEQEAGKQIEVKDVLLVSEGGNVEIGNPLVGEAVVKATVVSHGKGKKVTIFKKKRRKDYSVKRGHRQDYTELSIDGIKISRRKPKKTGEEPSVQAEAEEVPTQTAESADVTPAEAEAVEVKSGADETAGEVKTEAAEAADVKTEAEDTGTTVSVEKKEKKPRAPRKKKDTTE